MRLEVVQYYTNHLSGVEDKTVKTFMFDSFSRLRGKTDGGIYFVAEKSAKDASVEVATLELNGDKFEISKEGKISQNENFEDTAYFSEGTSIRVVFSLID